MAKQELIVRPPPGAIIEPDNELYENRFKIPSSSSSKLYLIARHKQSGKWCCSCTGWITQRYCKHLRGLAIPEFMSHQREEMQRKKLG